MSLLNASIQPPGRGKPIAYPNQVDSPDGHDDDVASSALDPAMECNDAILVMREPFLKGEWR